MPKRGDIKAVQQQIRPGTKLRSFKVWWWRQQRLKVDPAPRGIPLSPGVHIYDLDAIEAWVERRRQQATAGGETV
jgi:hypothetical protein